MKNVLTLFAIVVAFFVIFISVAFAAAETKTVCKYDEKAKKEVCKEVKVHKKIEGAKVPEAAPKK